MPERLVERSVSHQTTVRLGSGAGEFIPTTVGLFPSVFTPILSKAVFGLAVANLSWMHARSVVNRVLGSAPEKERRALRSIRTIAVQSTPPNSLMMKHGTTLCNMTV